MRDYNYTKMNTDLAPMAQLTCGFQICRLGVSELGSKRAQSLLGTSELEALHKSSNMSQKRYEPVEVIVLSQ